MIYFYNYFILEVSVFDEHETSELESCQTYNFGIFQNFKKRSHEQNRL